MIARLVDKAGASMSREQQSRMREKLMRAGFPGGFQAAQIVAIQKLCGPVFAGTIGGILFLLKTSKHMDISLTILFLLAALGYLLGRIVPDVVISRLIAKRKKQILLTLPDMIDLLTVSVEAGLSFEAAMRQVSRRFRGPLGEEFQSVNQAMAMGRPRADALREMAARSEVPDLSQFVSSIVQAEELGVSIGNVLRVQSEQMRERRSQRAREQAQKAPVKMMIPLVLFIFPTLFIVIMGPACITGYKQIKGSGIEF